MSTQLASVLQTEATPTNQVQTAKDHHEGHEEHEGEESQNKTLNLVEDDTGHPKILDFGVARVTDADGKANTFQTRDGQLLGTLPYMSPEQIRGDSTQVDHRSDVYAMGVIAYELLTERLPHDLDGKPVLEAARIVQSDPLTRMSVVDRGFRGDVETMVAKAMEKDPTRRYPSAADFSRDIRRHLSDVPISARPPSTICQLHKFARRNRAIVVGVAVAISLLIVAVIGTSYGLIVARAERDEARRAADKAEAVRQFFLGVLATPAPGVAGRDVRSSMRFWTPRRRSWQRFSISQR